MENSSYHIPVMLQQCIEGLEIKPGGTYVDVTLGGAGHSRLIASKLTTGTLYSFDQDDEAIVNASGIENLVPVKANFGHLKKFLRLNGVKKVDGILADLGVSSHQIDCPERGFSYRYPEEKLDMRMSTQISLTAADVLNTYSEKDLHKIFGIYGELKNAKGLASAVVRGRVSQDYEVIQDFLDAAEGFISVKTRAKYLAQVFQALRIEVNQEMHVLEEMLFQSAEVLNPGGLLVVMSYHSLEDRLVKNFIQKGKFKGELEKDFFGNPIRPLEQVNRKLITASDEEIATNKRARSAKLRIARRIEEEEWQRT